MRSFRVFKIFLLTFLLALGPAWAADIYWDGSQQFFDSRGRPLSGGTIETFDAQTTTQRTTYQNSGETVPHTNPITLGSDGRIPASVFVKQGNWKYILRDSGGSTIRTVDDIPGASVQQQVTFARRICDTLSKTSLYSATLDDLGKCIEANATGGAFSVSLPSAIDAGNGAMLTVRKSDSGSNIVTVTTVGGQTIGGTGSSVQLATQGSLIEVVSDGANWQPNNSTAIQAGSIGIGELDPGLAGLIPKVGTPILWLNDACPAGYLPADGSAQAKSGFQDLYNLWSANGTRTSLYGESGDNFNMPDSRGYFIRQVDGGSGRDPEVLTRTARPDAAPVTANSVGTTQADAFKKTTASLINRSPPGIAGTLTTFIIGSSGGSLDVTAGGTNSGGAADIEVDGGSDNETRPKNFNYLVCILASPQAVVGTPVVTNTILSGPGVPISTTGQNGDFWISTSDWEIYLKTGGAWVRQTNIVGIAQLDYRFDAATAEAEPNSIRLNNTTSANITEVYIRDTGAAGQAYAAYIATWGNSTTTQNRGQIKVTRRGFDDRYVLLRITAAVDTAPTNYTKLTVEHVSSSDASVTNILAEADKTQVAFSRTGDAGNAPGLNYSFSTTTTDPVGSRPGAGVSRLNNTDASSANQAFIDNVDAFGNDVRPIMLEWDQSTTLNNRGQLLVQQTNDPDTFAVYNITGANDTSETLYMKVTLTHVDSKFPGATTTFPNNAPLTWAFFRTGDAGGPGADGAPGTDPGTLLLFNAVAGVSDPGSGRVKFNNAAIASVTRLSVSKENGISPTPANIGAWVLSWDDVTNAGSRGIIHIADRNAPDVNFAIFDVTAASSDNTGTPGWVEVVVTHRSSAGSFSAATPLSVQFVPAGSDGAGVPNAFATVISQTGGSASGNTITATGSDTLRVNALNGVKATGVGANNRVDLELNFDALTGVAITATDVLAFRDTSDNHRKVNANKIAIGKHTIWIPGGAMTPSGTAGAAIGSRELADGQPTLPTMNYVHTSNTSAQFNFAFPKGADAAASITYLVAWTASAGTVAQTVLWRLACLARANDEALGTAFGTAANSNDAFIAANDQHDSPESAALTVAGTLAAEKTVYCRLLRDTSDTLNQTVEVIGAKVFYTTGANTDD